MCAWLHMNMYSIVISGMQRGWYLIKKVWLWPLLVLEGHHRFFYTHAISPLDGTTFLHTVPLNTPLMLLPGGEVSQFECPSVACSFVYTWWPHRSAHLTTSTISGSECGWMPVWTSVLIYSADDHALQTWLVPERKSHSRVELTCVICLIRDGSINTRGHE